MKTIGHAAFIVAILLSSGICAAAPAEKDAMRLTFDIKAQRLDTALTAFAQATGLQLLFPSNVAMDQAAPPVTGSLTPDAALQLLLKDSGLSYQYVNPKTVAIRAKTDERSAANGATPQAASDDIQLAQATQTGESGGLKPAAAARSQADSEDSKEIVVTGTHIRGTAPIGSPLVTVTREELEASGHARIQDYFEFLPQNFSGSASEDSVRDLGAANATRGQAVDLRGLGASSTLVLINGHRVANGGTEGVFADISNLPMSAIERVEILTDGASALYGSDAVGGVVNFITRKDYSGAEVSARFGTSDGAGSNRDISALGGISWHDTGNLMLGYHYSMRDDVRVADTAYGPYDRDFRALGGNDFRTAGGNPGTLYDAANVPRYEIPRGQNGVGLSAGALVPIISPTRYFDTISGVDALPRQEIHGVFANVSQQIGPRLNLFAEARYSRRDMDMTLGPYTTTLFVPPSNPFDVNPFGAGNVRVSYSFVNEFGSIEQSSQTEASAATLGGSLELGSGWDLNLSASYSTEDDEWSTFTLTNALLTAALANNNPLTALNVFGEGSNTNPATLAALRTTIRYTGKNTVNTFGAIASGPIWSLPTGEIKVAAGVDFRDEKLDARKGSFNSAGAFVNESAYVGSIDRQVMAAFGEVTVPLLSPLVGRKMAANASFAARYEDYSDFGTTFDPKIGVDFSPFSSIKARASWGTSFRAPRFNELSRTSRPSSAFLTSGPDPQSATPTTSIFLVIGSGFELKEETAQTWTAGLDFTPRGIDGLRVSGTFFDIKYKDKIQTGGNGFLTLLDAARWSSIITRNPTSAQIAAFCNDPTIQLIGTCPTSAGALIDGRLRNLGGLRVRGVDADVRYSRQLGESVLSAGLAGTYTMDYAIAVSPSTPYVDSIDVAGYPLALKLRGNVGVAYREFKFNTLVNYADDYVDLTRTRKVDSWTTIDATLSYTFGTAGWLEGTRLQFGIVNAFDKAPPFVNTNTGFDGANANQTGRALNISIAKEL